MGTDRQQSAHELRLQGLSLAAIGRRLGISKQAVHKRLQRHQHDQEQGAGVAADPPQEPEEEEPEEMVWVPTGVDVFGRPTDYQQMTREAARDWDPRQWRRMR